MKSKSKISMKEKIEKMITSVLKENSQKTLMTTVRKMIGPGKTTHSGRGFWMMAFSKPHDQVEAILKSKFELGDETDNAIGFVDSPSGIEFQLLKNSSEIYF